MPTIVTAIDGGAQGEKVPVHTDLMAGANQITDHYLVALARHHHLTLATFDEALAKTFGKRVGIGAIGPLEPRPIVLVLSLVLNS